MDCSCCDPAKAPQEDAQLPRTTDNLTSPPNNADGATQGNNTVETTDELDFSLTDCYEDNVALPEHSSRSDCCGIDSGTCGAGAPSGNAQVSSNCNETDGPRDAQSIFEGMAGSCCSTLRQPSSTSCKETGSPECCRDKPFPCCDDSCIERLALRECDEVGECHRGTSDSYGACTACGMPIISLNLAFEQGAHQLRRWRTIARDARVRVTSALRGSSMPQNWLLWAAFVVLFLL